MGLYRGLCRGVFSGFLKGFTGSLDYSSNGVLGLQLGALQVSGEAEEWVGSFGDSGFRV